MFVCRQQVQPIVHDDDKQPRLLPSCLSQSNCCNDVVAAYEANCSCCLLSEISLAFTLFASKAVSVWTKKTIRETYTSCKVLRDSFEGKVPSMFFSLSFVHSKGWETRRVVTKGHTWLTSLSNELIILTSRTKMSGDAGFEVGLCLHSSAAKKKQKKQMDT